MKNFIALVLGILVLNVSLPAQNRKEGGRDNKPAGIFHTDVPDHLYDIILGRITNQEVTLSILANEDMTGHIEYGVDPKNLSLKSSTVNITKRSVQFVELKNLLADKRYYYRLICKRSNSDQSIPSELNFFQTQRSVNKGFTFTVQADSHLDENTAPEIYLKTLNNMSTDSADFLVDLGDTWMTDKYRNGFKESLKQYYAQRYYFGLLCKSSCLYLTLGNHDGESGQQRSKGEDGNMTIWSTKTRLELYPNPIPNNLYSGNIVKESGLGYPENYYSWKWGDALFIVLDPFRYTTDNNNPWQRTLGLEQYNWLKNTLAKSRASFKFVFIHNLVGGEDLNGKGRGGAEAARYYEWGGLDADGTNKFSENRPGWEKPIHELLKSYHVDIVFHGHDHFFARQQQRQLIFCQTWL
ncbi:MAG: metallophosphoesterase, partial [Mariniphaga sp.]